MEFRRDHYLYDLINRKYNGMIMVIEIALDDRKGKELRNPDVYYQYVRDCEWTNKRA